MSTLYASLAEAMTDDERLYRPKILNCYIVMPRSQSGRGVCRGLASSMMIKDHPLKSNTGSLDTANVYNIVKMYITTKSDSKNVAQQFERPLACPVPNSRHEFPCRPSWIADAALMELLLASKTLSAALPIFSLASSTPITCWRAGSGV